MALPHIVVKPATPAEALGMAADRRNWGFRVGMELGSKVYEYTTGNLTKVTWTITLPTTAGGTYTRVYDKTYTWVGGQLTAESEWTENP